jgi:DNA-binding transcriptional ArsR family regulator
MGERLMSSKSAEKTTTMEMTLNSQDLEILAERFKILSDPARLQILSAICERECKVNEICQRTGLKQANVSKHLQLLKIARVVTCRRVGACRYYRVIDSDLLSLCLKAQKTWLRDQQKGSFENLPLDGENLSASAGTSQPKNDLKAEDRSVSALLSSLGEK